ncbi:hypothetical protein LINGRAHAP2_LOCUS7123 [Linum grandiflorum]
MRFIMCILSIFSSVFNQPLLPLSRYAQLGEKNAFMEALENKTGNDSSITATRLRARYVMERAKIKRCIQLEDKITEVAQKLEGRMDWSLDKIDNIKLGKTLLAQKARNKLKPILEDAETRSLQSEYLSDPHVEF